MSGLESVVTVGLNLGPPWNEGVGNLVHDQTSYLTSQGIATTIITTPAIISTTGRENRMHRRIEVLVPMRRRKYRSNPINHLWFAASLIGLLPEVLEERPGSVLHVHLWGSPLLRVIIRRAKTVGSPVVWSVHSPEALRFILPPKSRLLNSIDALTYPRREVRQELLRIGAESSKLHFLPVLVDTGRFAPLADVPAARTRLGLPTDKVLCVYAGHIRRDRGPEVALRGFLNAGVDRVAHLAIADSGMGSDQLRSRLRQLASKTSSVSFLGMQDKMETLFGCADILLFPLTQSKAAIATPRTVLEAMASGVAVISTRWAGVPEIIEEDKNGLLSPTASVNDFSERLRLMIDDEELRSMLGRNARRKVKENHSLDQMGRRLIELYLGCKEDVQGR